MWLVDFLRPSFPFIELQKETMTTFRKILRLFPLAGASDSSTMPSPSTLSPMTIIQIPDGSPDFVQDGKGFRKKLAAENFQSGLGAEGSILSDEVSSVLAQDTMVDRSEQEVRFCFGCM